jgi:hypothetical protein
MRFDLDSPALVTGGTGNSSRNGDNAVISNRQTRRPDSNRASAHQVSPMR